MAQPCPTPEHSPADSHLSLAPVTPAAKVPNGRIHYRRIWLNRPGHHGSAHIIAEVAIDRGKKSVDITASFLISDCTRNVTIDCDIWPTATAAQRHNAVRKARLVRDAAAAFCEALETAVAEHETVRAARRRPRKKAQNN